MVSRKSTSLNSNFNINNLFAERLGLKSLNERLDEVAKIISYFSFEVSSETIRRQLKIAGFNEDEISDSRNVIYVNIRSRLYFSTMSEICDKLKTIKD